MDSRTAKTEAFGEPRTANGLLGRHRIVAKLGQGGMANVFLAVAPGPVGLNKLVVIKRLRENQPDADFADMFLNEAHIAARLNHPNVIQLYEVVENDGEIYFVMEFLDGQPLQHIRTQFGVDPASLALHLRILCDASLGLHYAHELTDYDGTPLGIVHRDMSPQNVFVTYDGSTKVLDFGIAKALNQTIHTRVGGVKGKIQYMSPEQARGGNQPIDRRSDLFTLGILIWEAAAGRRLWQGEDEVVVFQRLMRGETVASPRTVNPMVHPQLERICMRALDPEARKRHATAEELRLELEAYMESQRMRVGSVEVGRFLSEKFSKQREALRATIESELKANRTSSRVIEIDTGGSASGKRPSSAQSTWLSPLPATATVAPFRRRLSSWQVAALLGLIGLAIVGARLALRDSSNVKTFAAIPVASSAASSETAAAPSEVRLSVQASPATARLLLDEQPLGIGSFTGSVPRAPGTHRLRAEAAGFQPKTIDVSLEFDSSVAISLSPEPPVAKSPKGERRMRAATPATASTPPAPGKPASKRKPAIVTIDTEDPW